MTQQAEILQSDNYRPVLDHGFIGLIATMGDDSAVVQAARVSYGAGTKTVSEDRGLIRYLMRHKHTTPFEMCEVKMHVRAPILVIRQWQRHRTGSFNEESARYSEMTDEFFLPDPEFIQPQAKDNKQGRVGTLDPVSTKGVRWLMEAAYDHAHQTYQLALGDRIGKDPSKPGFDLLYDPYDEEDPLLSTEFPGVARELARAVMPLGSYSEFYWKLNLWNLFNFLRLRNDPHAQREIRVFAEAITELARPHFPVAFAAFDDYIRHAVSLSRMDADLMLQLLHPGDGETPKSRLETMLAEAGSVKALAAQHGMSVREMRDFAERWQMDDLLADKPVGV